MVDQTEVPDPQKSITAQADQCFPDPETPLSRCSFSSSDSDIGSTRDKVVRQRHDGHWDRVVYWNMWDPAFEATDPDATFFWRWRDDAIQRGRYCRTNEELENEPSTQAWLKSVACLRRAGAIEALRRRPALQDSAVDFSESLVPLFEAGNGDHYQIHVSFLAETNLPEVYCPIVLDKLRNTSDDLYQIKSRMSSPVPRDTVSTLPVPTFVIPVGTLKVRTASRSAKFFPNESFVTEITDYRVVIDVGRVEMPVWLVGARDQLQSRFEGVKHKLSVEALPIFNGLMASDDGGYDMACLLPSIRHLAARQPDPNAPTYEAACDLVRKTRTSIDPVTLMLPRKVAQEFWARVEEEDDGTVDETEKGTSYDEPGNGDEVGGSKAAVTGEVIVDGDSHDISAKAESGGEAIGSSGRRGKVNDTDPVEKSKVVVGNNAAKKASSPKSTVIGGLGSGLARLWGFLKGGK